MSTSDTDHWLEPDGWMERDVHTRRTFSKPTPERIAGKRFDVAFLKPTPPPVNALTWRSLGDLLSVGAVLVESVASVRDAYGSELGRLNSCSPDCSRWNTCFAFSR